MATGLLATWQSTAWLGAEAGIFKKRGIDMSLPAIAVGGPQAAATVIRGDCEFAHTGTLPVAEEGAQRPRHRDPRNPDVGICQFVRDDPQGHHASRAVERQEGRSLDRDWSNQRAARIAVEKAGATATYLPLIKFDRIYTALATGEIDAGALPIDLRFVGVARYGWNAFPIQEFGTPSIFASTRKLIASDRALVMNVMQGLRRGDPSVQDTPRRRHNPCCSAIWTSTIERLPRSYGRFTCRCFKRSPRPSFPGMRTLRELLDAKYPAAASLKESDIADSSFVDELERNGFIGRLYAGGTK